MAETTTITVRLETHLKDRLEALARSTRRSKSWLAAEAIAAYVEREAWQIEQIESAVEQANHNDTTWITHEAVISWLEQLGMGSEEHPADTATRPAIERSTLYSSSV
jgi:RHH-type transcriptional regulator, rel operon repressor / antitoxin RelB